MREEGSGSMKQACGNCWSWVMSGDGGAVSHYACMYHWDASVIRKLQKKLPRKFWSDHTALMQRLPVFRTVCAHLHLCGIAEDHSPTHAEVWKWFDWNRALRIQRGEQVARSRCSQVWFAPQTRDCFLGPLFDTTLFPPFSVHSQVTCNISTLTFYPIVSLLCVQVCI